MKTILYNNNIYKKPYIFMNTRIFYNINIFMIFYRLKRIIKRKVDIGIDYTELLEIKILHLSYMFL
jgi:hypothetical protein